MTKKEINFTKKWKHLVPNFILYLCSCVWLFVTIRRRNKDKRMLPIYMKTKQEVFFLTKLDIIKMMSKVEKRNFQ